MINIDGSRGEGGGQVLRTCLSLSAITGKPFRIFKIRAGRKKPGLRPQHLTAVRAVAAVCQADLEGDGLESTELRFLPGSAPVGGSYRFDVRDASPSGRSAGSVTLILQAVNVVQDAKIAGHEKVGGVQTTRVDGQVSLAGLSKVGGGKNASAEVSSAPIPVSIWIDKDNRIQEIELAGQILTSESTDVIHDITFSDFDKPVDIQKPPV